jgi:hypothetical protein
VHRVTDNEVRKKYSVLLLLSSFYTLKACQGSLAFLCLAFGAEKMLVFSPLRFPSSKCFFECLSR